MHWAWAWAYCTLYHRYYLLSSECNARTNDDALSSFWMLVAVPLSSIYIPQVPMLPKFIYCFCVVSPASTAYSSRGNGNSFRVCSYLLWTSSKQPTHSPSRTRECVCEWAFEAGNTHGLFIYKCRRRREAEAEKERMSGARIVGI